MSTRNQSSAKQIVSTTRQLVDLIKQSPRPDIAGSWVVNTVMARTPLSEMILVDSQMEPMERLGVLLGYVEVALAELHADGEHREDDISQVVAMSALKVLGYLPDRGWWPGDSGRGFLRAG